jgi:hypothetical protein
MTVSLSLQITHEVFFAQPNSCLVIILPSANSGDNLDSLLQMPTSKQLNYNSSCVISTLYNLGTAPTEDTTSSIVSCLFTAAEMCLPHRCIADHRKHRSCIVASVHFHGNVFTEPLLSNEIFRPSGIMSHYTFVRRLWIMFQLCKSRITSSGI